MSKQQPAGDKKTERKPTDLTTLETVNVSFNRPAKWYMYVVKQALKSRETLDIRARPLGAPQLIRVAEALKRLGYITYEKYYTITELNEGNLRRYIYIKVKKTKEFQKLFDEREAERTKMLEEKQKDKKEEKK